MSNRRTPNWPCPTEGESNVWMEILWVTDIWTIVTITNTYIYPGSFRVLLDHKNIILNHERI